jgi:hypothetical protein
MLRRQSQGAVLGLVQTSSVVPRPLAQGIF